MKKVAEFTTRLNEVLEAYKMGPTELGEKIGKAKSTVSMYMSGERSPKCSTVGEIAQLFGVNPAWLMGFDVEKYLSDSKSEQEIALSPIEKELMLECRKYFGVQEIGEAQREDVILDVEVLKYFHNLNKNGKKSVITHARGCCLEKDYVNEEYAEKTLA